MVWNPAHRRAVEPETLLEYRFGQLADGEREVVLHTGYVGEAHVHELGTLGCRQRNDFLGS